MITQLPPTADHILLSLNPKAGRRDPAVRAEKLRRALTDAGYRVELLTDLAVVARRADELYATRKLRALVGVGGDGTAAELVNRTAVGVPITLLPSGTANLLAKEFRFPVETSKIVKMIRVGTVLTFDAGRAVPFSGDAPFSAVDSASAELSSAPSLPSSLPANGRLFLVLASVGIDAEIVRSLHARREESFRRKEKGGAHIGYLSYIRPIFRSVFTYSYSPMAVEIRGIIPLGRKKDSPGGAARAETSKWGFVFNVPRYGFGVAPVVGGRLDDGRLDFCLFGRGGLIPSLFGIFCAQFGGLHRFLPRTRLGTGHEFLFRPVRKGEKIPLELDGDPAGFLPVRMETVPGRVTFVVPDDYVRRYRKRGEKDDDRATVPGAACGVELRVKP